ncbi:histidine kinase [Pontimicrobium sp. SW4]|uniref:Histidine kinase n=1 Tax=Pontimicrobium sp. SW4 TaxID=3153519 RepID=A0AAU7BW10_9FLAO
MKNTNSQYWRYQILGWSFASLYWAYIAYFIQDYSMFHTTINFILDVCIGVFLTHLYKLTVSKVAYIPFKKFAFIQVGVSIIILAILFMLLNNVKWYIYWVIIQQRDFGFINSLFFWNPPLITGLRLMSIWVLAYHLYHYYKQQIIITKRSAKLSVLAKQEQLNHLSKQLKPHFLFNSLNSVKSLISENPSKARRSIDLLSDLLRSSIYTKDSLITIENELQLVYDYIELEKLRFEERLQLKMIIDKMVLNYKIPSLSIQTLVENAVKYGIQSSVKGGTIEINMSKQSGSILIQVKNPGQLIVNKNTDERLGLNNLTKRLQLHYKEKAKFTLVETSDSIVVATIIIPINE